MDELVSRLLELSGDEFDRLVVDLSWSWVGRKVLSHPEVIDDAIDALLDVIEETPPGGRQDGLRVAAVYLQVKKAQQQEAQARKERPAPTERERAQALDLERERHALNRERALAASVSAESAARLQQFATLVALLDLDPLKGASIVRKYLATFLDLDEPKAKQRPTRYRRNLTGQADRHIEKVSGGLVARSLRETG